MYECKKCGKTSPNEDARECNCDLPLVEINVKSLTAAYNKAVKENKDVFEYNGHSMFTSYVKYLLEYLNQNKK